VGSRAYSCPSMMTCRGAPPAAHLRAARPLVAVLAAGLGGNGGWGVNAAESRAGGVRCRWKAKEEVRRRCGGSEGAAAKEGARHTLLARTGSVSGVMRGYFRCCGGDGDGDVCTSSRRTAAQEAAEGWMSLGRAR
jgi:hypothetical protein